MSQDPAVPAPRNTKNWLWVVGLVAVLVVAGVVLTGGSGGKTAAAPPPATSTSTEAPRPGLETAPTAPAAPPPVVHIVVYEVTGTGTGDITFGTDGAGGTEVVTGAALPWTTTVELPAGAEPQSASVVAVGGASEIGARITVDGQVAREGASSPAYNSVSLTATVGPRA